MDNSLGFTYKEEDREKECSFEQIKLIYNRLGDELSKRIYTNRLMFSMTEDASFMRNIILETKEGAEMFSQLLERQDKDIWIYGAGMRGRRLLELFPEIEWKGFVDYYKTGTVAGLPIISVEELKNSQIKKNMVIVISLFYGYEVVKEQLLACQYEEKQIVTLGDYDSEMQENMYFDSCIGDITDLKGYFVDAGAFDGADTVKYVTRFDKYKRKNIKAIVFEPDKKNYDVCIENLVKYRGVKVHNAALSNKADKKVLYGENSQGCSLLNIVRGEEGILCEGKEIVPCVKLDEILREEECGFIKMDVEGSEMQALLGAQNIITNQTPKLAISVYHKREDIWNIPLMLLKFCSKYKFYLRHYTVSYGDTVLYAVAESNNDEEKR